MPGSKIAITDWYVIPSLHFLRRRAEFSYSKTSTSKYLFSTSSRSQINDFTLSRTQSFVQEPPHNGNPLAILPYQTTNVDARRREKKVKMMNYIAGFDHKFRR
ncbi:hypothetical protein diail_9090 [Diaporthe ilicicola]|nr:hypothetical protein diail_9090 [Diaporthe ilicicola]